MLFKGWNAQSQPLTAGAADDPPGARHAGRLEIQNNFGSTCT